mmetsp:Transcript_5580/g.15703  ORF Transcript_5580/g.15703 Transcript_5580/m.15703 type:complete len:211 (-) Transcript_5580:1211-1843(-)
MMIIIAWQPRDSQVLCPNNTVDVHRSVHVELRSTLACLVASHALIQVKSITSSTPPPSFATTASGFLLPSSTSLFFSSPSSLSSRSISIVSSPFANFLPASSSASPSESRQMGSLLFVAAAAAATAPALLAREAARLASRSAWASCANKLQMRSTLVTSVGSSEDHWRISFTISDRFSRKCFFITSSNSGYAFVLVNMADRWDSRAASKV